MNKKKKQIIEVAHKLFIEKGFANTSIQDILDEAKIAKGTFYNYFTSKNECLISILEVVKEEAEEIRKELLIGKSLADEQVFAEQVSARLHIDQKHNIMALFSTTTIMNDKELRQFMINMHVNELRWIAQRFIQLYGEEMKEIAFDQAVTFLGILQHVLQVKSIRNSTCFSPNEAVQFALKQVRTLIQQKPQPSEALFTDWITTASADTSSEEKSLAMLAEEAIEAVETVLKDAPAEKQLELYEFIYSELKNDYPRVMVLESIWITLSQAKDTLSEKQKDLLTALSSYLEKRKQESTKPGASL